jgi:hypothetical protein
MYYNLLNEYKRVIINVKLLVWCGFSQKINSYYSIFTKLIVIIIKVFAILRILAYFLVLAIYFFDLDDDVKILITLIYIHSFYLT